MQGGDCSNILNFWAPINTQPAHSEHGKWTRSEICANLSYWDLWLLGAALI